MELPGPLRSYPLAACPAICGTRPGLTANVPDFYPGAMLARLRPARRLSVVSTSSYRLLMSSRSASSGTALARALFHGGLVRIAAGLLREGISLPTALETAEPPGTD